MTMNQITNEEMNLMKGNIEKEWKNVLSYYSDKTEEERYTQFKELYDNLEGEEILEFNRVSELVYAEWEEFKYRKYGNTGFRSRSKDRTSKKFGEAWREFKEFWQWGTPETERVFKEMEHMSGDMKREWRLKYNFVFPGVYEELSWTSRNVEKLLKKTKGELWEEFKEFWDLDVNDYDEHILKEMLKYIRETGCDNFNYGREYPRNFYEFRENGNYHSYDCYSIYKKNEICEEWNEYKERIEQSESEDDE